jgi:hypothetical protein
MTALLDTLDYDFEQFTLEGFRRWLEDRQGRRIEFVALPLQSASGGLITTTGGCNLVFYPINLPEVYQTHAQLHEMSHIILGHPGVALDFLREIGIEAFESLLLRSPHSDEAELEAEMLASLIKERARSRLQELTQAIAPSEGFTDYFSDYIRTLGDE